MNKLIGCGAAGILLLAMGMDSPASARPGGGAGRGSVAAHASGYSGGFGARGGFSGSAFRGASTFSARAGVASAPMVGGGSPVFRANNPAWRGNGFAFRRGDHDGDRFRHRRFIGAGVFASSAYPYYYDDSYYDGAYDSGYYYDNGDYTGDAGDCAYILVRRDDDGTLHRVYSCQ